LTSKLDKPNSAYILYYSLTKVLIEEKEKNTSQLEDVFEDH